MFLGGTLEYAVFVAWYSRKKDQQKSKNNLCICYGKKKSASPLSLPTILHVPNTCLLSSIETQIITYQTCPQSQRTKTCPYIKFRYFEKIFKNNLTLCFEDWKVSFKKMFSNFVVFLQYLNFTVFSHFMQIRTKGKYLSRFSNPDEKEVYFWNLSKGSE